MALSRRVERRWTASVAGWLAWVRRWGTETLQQALPDQTIQGLAIALILGDGGPLGKDEWWAYKRTGVIHVLVISGQHLMLLAACWFWLLPRLGCRQRQTALFIIVFLLLYVGVTGLRPPSLRSAVAACSLFGGWILARRFVQANSLALAWIVVLWFNPTNIFDPGCQLSFLCILVLYRFGMLWEQQRAALDNQDPHALPRLLAELRPGGRGACAALPARSGKAI